MSFNIFLEEFLVTKNICKSKNFSTTFILVHRDRLLSLIDSKVLQLDCGGIVLGSNFGQT
jgi:hypothetical protein